MNRIALITGATSGIGEACARKFAGSGYDLVLTGRNKEKLEAMKAELEGVEVTTLAFDRYNNSFQCHLNWWWRFFWLQWLDKFEHPFRRYFDRWTCFL